MHVVDAHLIADGKPAHRRVGAIAGGEVAGGDQRVALFWELM